MPQADQAPAERRRWGRGGLIGKTRITDNRPEHPEVFGKFIGPNRQVEAQIERLSNQILGIQLENFDAFFRTIMPFGFHCRGAATGTGVWFVLAAATRILNGQGLRPCTNGVALGKNGKRAGAHTVAVNLLHTDPDRRTQQCGHPKPEERFFYSCGHSVEGSRVRRFEGLKVRGFGGSAVSAGSAGSAGREVRRLQRYIANTTVCKQKLTVRRILLTPPNLRTPAVRHKDLSFGHLKFGYGSTSIQIL